MYINFLLTYLLTFYYPSTDYTPYEQITLFMDTFPLAKLINSHEKHVVRDEHGYLEMFCEYQSNEWYSIHAFECTYSLQVSNLQTSKEHSAVNEKVVIRHSTANDSI